MYQCSCQEDALYDRLCNVDNCRALPSLQQQCASYDNNKATLKAQCNQVSGVATMGTMPCQSERALCRQSMMVVNQFGVMVESSEWQQAVGQESAERTRCNNALSNCYGGQSTDCSRYDNCIPQATSCMTTATVSSYGGFRTAECIALVQCMKDGTNVKQTCVAAFGGNMVGTDASQRAVTCDTSRICDMAVASAGDLGCAGRNVLDCESVDDCVWHKSSQRCWDKPSDRETVELTLMILAALVICFIILIGAAYMAYACSSYRTTGFDKQQDHHELRPMDPQMAQY